MKQSKPENIILFTLLVCVITLVSVLLFIKYNYEKVENKCLELGYEEGYSHFEYSKYFQCYYFEDGKYIETDKFSWEMIKK